jgi:hypothetical protein
MTRFSKVFSVLSTCVLTLFMGLLVAQAQEENTQSEPCVYLSTPIIADEINNKAAVLKLQQFLYTHEKLPIALSGVYDKDTITAVQIFQMRYAGDILTPWGLTRPTRDASVTTLHKINELYCAVESTLSIGELQEIQAIRTKYREKTRSVGSATTSSTTPPLSEGSLNIQKENFAGVQVGFLNEFSLPILIMLFVLLSVQFYFMRRKAAFKKAEIIPREFK